MASSSARTTERELGELSIDRRAEVPISVQLGWALRARIEEGGLKPGERLPGVRELADALGVNVNTVRSVYRRIEQAGLVESRQGSGTFVSGVTLRSEPAAGRIAAEAARKAHERGVDPRDVAAALYVSRAAPGAGAVSIDDAARRRELRDQIASLERALGGMEAEYAAILPPPATSRRRGIGPALLTAHELEQTRAELLRRLNDVQDRIKRHAAAAGARAERAGVTPRRRRPQARSRTEPQPQTQSRAQVPTDAQAGAAKGKRRRVRPATRPAPAGT